MNIAKIVDALNQTDKLCYGFTTNDGGGCTIAQLFYAAGYSQGEIMEECNKNNYHTMFDNILEERYGLDNIDSIAVIYYANDRSVEESDKARHIRMIEWFKNQDNEEPIECQAISHSSSPVEEELKVCVGV